MVSRCARWHPLDPQALFDALCSFFKSHSSLPACVRFAVLKVACNAVLTSGRFQMRNKCVLCDLPGSLDKVEHYLRCPSLRPLAWRLLSRDIYTFGDHPVGHLLFLLQAEGTLPIKTALMCDAICTLASAPKALAPLPSEDLFLGCLKLLAVRFPCLWSYVQFDHIAPCPPRRLHRFDVAVLPYITTVADANRSSLG